MTAQGELPVFSEAARDGTCPRCGGHQFRRARIHAGRASLGIGQHGVGGLMGLGLAAKRSGDQVECVTCGLRFRKG